MIKVLGLNDFDLQSVEVYTLPPDRPLIKNKFRKLLFFIFHEGFLQTIRKFITQRNNSLNYIDNVRGVRNKLGHNGVTYDGENYFFSDNVTDEWENPFSYDFFDETALVDANCEYGSGNLFFIGYGSYAQTYGKKLSSKFMVNSIVDYNSLNFFGMDSNGIFCSINFNDILPRLKNIDRPAVIISSYHSDHARQLKKIIDCNHKSFVMVEKPPYVKAEELKIYQEIFKEKYNVQIGFNRRYAPLSLELKSRLSTEPAIINISVNEVAIDPSHWYFWKIKEQELLVMLVTG